MTRILTQRKFRFLNDWLLAHNDVQHRHPFNELIPLVQNALADRRLTQDEKDDISWLCQRLSNDTGYTDFVSASMRHLHGILGGIAADGKILPAELKGLQDWLSEHSELRTCWPFDEIDSIVTTVLADQKIDRKEHKSLLELFSGFVESSDKHTLAMAPIKINGTVVGICAVDPAIIFSGKIFCITGASKKYSRADFAELITRMGGVFTNSMSKKVRYLIVGGDGNPCWQYSCYGRKVEAAMTLRQSGINVVIVHENDFHDAVADIGDQK